MLLGCPPLPSQEPSPALLRRCTALFLLAQQFPHIPIVLSGGGTPSEAQCAAHVLIRWGIEKERLVLEEQSTSTEENARYSSALVGKKRVVVVSDSYHLLRGYLVFRRYFEQVELAAADTPRLWRAWLRELTVLGIYGGRGFLWPFPKKR